MKEVFANHSEEDEIYPLTTVEIAAAQWADASLKHLFKRNAVIEQGLEIKLIENMTCMQRWSAGYPQITPSASSQVVSSLSATPWTYTS